MSNGETGDDEDYLSPKDIRNWVQQEIKDAARALELRVNELTDLVIAYSAGELTPEKAEEAHARYYHRWGDALPVHVGPGVSDDEVLARIDKVRPPFVTPHASREEYRRLFSSPLGDEKRSR